MMQKAPKVSITIDQLGSAEGADRAEFVVQMTLNGVARTCAIAFEGKTESPYTRALEWDDEQHA
jgi:hypothetical protein